MDDTTPIASFRTPDAADAAAELLRANAIRCAVADAPLPPVDPLSPGLPQGEGHTVVVASEDAERAREALDGFLDAAWFLRARDGRRVHAFETAAAERLRRHAATEADPDGWAARDCARLADLLDAARAPQVAALFRHEPEVEGRTLAEWAHACGCEPVERA
ncbi:MAG TPA: hypothetical protein VFW14_02510 [Gaiellales bacterium]|nr:hypothetical protein [Gaiellales bacterium]